MNKNICFLFCVVLFSDFIINSADKKMEQQKNIELCIVNVILRNISKLVKDSELKECKEMDNKEQAFGSSKYQKILVVSHLVDYDKNSKKNYMKKRESDHRRSF